MTWGHLVFYKQDFCVFGESFLAIFIIIFPLHKIFLAHNNHFLMQTLMVSIENYRYSLISFAVFVKIVENCNRRLSHRLFTSTYCKKNLFIKNSDNFQCCIQSTHPLTIIRMQLDALKRCQAISKIINNARQSKSENFLSVFASKE